MNDPMVKFKEGYFGQQGQIESVRLGKEDHDIFTFCLMFNFGGNSQGFMGYTLDDPLLEHGEFVRRRGSASGMDLIIRIIGALGVDSWEDIKGVRAWALFETIEYSSPIIGVRALAGEHSEDLKPLVIKEWKQEWFPEKS